MENKLFPDEQVLKKEDKLKYYKSFINIQMGSLVLTSTELNFVGRVTKNKMFSIPLKDILSVNCQKGIGTGNENMYVLYKDGGKEKKVKVQHTSFMSFATVGNLSRIGGFYFSSWEQAINDARQGRREIGGGGELNDIRKLAELRDQGVITEEEFAAKKKQLLGI